MLYFIDLFCGAGGTTSGITRARVRKQVVAKVIACVNHDANAIKSHWQNHPEVKHFTEDIRTLDISPLINLVASIRAGDPGAIICLWASLECTNFSNAKGGMSRDADSRTLAEHLFRYVEGINFDYVYIENVREFEKWGPLKVMEKPRNKKQKIKYPHCPLHVFKNKKKKITGFGPTMVPIKEQMGIFYNAWKEKMQAYGYNFESRHLNSADYGAYTKRIRFFAQFAKIGLPIEWPKPTHTKDGTGKKKWKAVKDVLNLDSHGQSIFTRKQRLSDKTFERIYHGMIKFVAGGMGDFENFVMRYYSGSPEHRVHSILEPTGTVTTNNRLALATIKFLVRRGGANRKANTGAIPSPKGEIRPEFLSTYHGNGIGAHSVEGPAPTIPTKDSCSLVQPQFMVNYNHSSKSEDIDKPAPTLICKDKIALCTPEAFIMRDFKTPTHSGVSHPVGALTTNPKTNLVTPAYIMDTQYRNLGQSLDQPMQVITANRKHFYLMNLYAWGGKGSQGIDQPAFTLIARMDKAPPYLIELEGGNIGIRVYKRDTKHMVLIKEMMAMYGIIDVKMRMLEILELLRIQGFITKDHPAYDLIGTDEEKKKYIGNSCEVKNVQAMIETSCIALNTYILNRKAA